MILFLADTIWLRVIEFRDNGGVESPIEKPFINLLILGLVGKDVKKEEN